MPEATKATFVYRDCQQDKIFLGKWGLQPNQTKADSFLAFINHHFPHHKAYGHKYTLIGVIQGWVSWMPENLFT